MNKIFPSVIAADVVICAYDIQPSATIEDSEMAVIKAFIDSRNDLTIFTVHGELTADEIIQRVEAFYIQKPTPLVLWDATDGSVADITTEALQRVAYTILNYIEKRKEGKTALVCSMDADYGLGRMYEAFAENACLPYAYRTFRTIREAKQWLGVKR